MILSIQLYSPDATYIMIEANDHPKLHNYNYNYNYNYNPFF